MKRLLASIFPFCDSYSEKTYKLLRGFMSTVQSELAETREKVTALLAKVDAVVGGQDRIVTLVQELKDSLEATQELTSEQQAAFDELQTELDGQATKLDSLKESQDAVSAVTPAEPSDEFPREAAVDSGAPYAAQGLDVSQTNVPDSQAGDETVKPEDDTA